MAREVTFLQIVIDEAGVIFPNGSRLSSICLRLPEPRKCIKNETKLRVVVIESNTAMPTHFLNFASRSKPVNEPDYDSISSKQARMWLSICHPSLEPFGATRLEHSAALENGGSHDPSFK
jgi:hypothetical protein